MNNNEFTQVMKRLQEYLKREKTFVIDENRMDDLSRAVDIANELFPDNTTEIKDDPLQMGAEIIHIEGIDIMARGVMEINLFCEMLSLADNFEIYPVSESTIRLAAVFQNVLVKIN